MKFSSSSIQTKCKNEIKINAYIKELDIGEDANANRISRATADAAI